MDVLNTYVTEDHLVFATLILYHISFNIASVFYAKTLDKNSFNLGFLGFSKNSLGGALSSI